MMMFTDPRNAEEIAANFKHQKSLSSFLGADLMLFSEQKSADALSVIKRHKKLKHENKNFSDPASNYRRSSM